jgi:hypothetical protein
MSPGQVFKMAKQYVLMDQAEYDKAKGDSRKGEQEEQKQYPAINPFSNPRVKEVKADRKRIWETLEDENLSAEEANQKVRRLIDRYRLNFEKSVGKKSGASYGGGKIEQKKQPASPRPAVREVSPSVERRGVRREDRHDRSQNLEQQQRLQRVEPRVRNDLPRNAFFESSADVNKAMGGYTSSEDAEKIKGVMNELVKIGAMKKKRFVNVDETGFHATPTKMRQYIRESFIVDPSRRSLSTEQLQRFQNYLNRHDIDITIPESTQRVSGRQRPLFR